MKACLRRLGFAVLILSCVFIATVAGAQVATGTPKFGTFGGGPFDIINLANLNAHISVPVFSKPGRGIPFSYALSYDSSVWVPTGVSGHQTWQPVANWGWKGQTEVAVGYTTYDTSTIQCGYQGQTHGTIYANWVYHDTFGVAHLFGGVAVSTACTIGGSSTGTANDGSGFKIAVGTPSAVVTAPTGEIVNAPLLNSAGAGSVTDANGNQLTATGTSFTDTLGLTALSISGTGTPTSPKQFTYTDTSGSPRSVVVNYTATNVRTYFQCSGIGETTLSVNLISSIVYPDNTSYQFAYEDTPGNAGYKTGRLATITLPTGGTIQYSYTGINNGIKCADGSAMALSRVVDGGTTTYTRDFHGNPTTGTWWTTTVVDPKSNQTIYDFQTIFLTQKQTLALVSGSQAAATTQQICYSTNSAGPCTQSTSTAVALPIAYTKTYNILNNGQQNTTVVVYDGLGSVTTVNEYDFGSGTQGPLLRQTITAYSDLANGAHMPTSTTVKDGNANQVAQTTYAYDGSAVTATSGVPQHIAISGARANLTSITKWFSAGTNPVTTMTYDDTGMVKTVSDSGGHVTTLTYSSTYKNAYLSQIQLPTTGTITHITSAAYDLNTGFKTSDTDQNGKVTSYQYDSMLRPLTVSRPDGGTTTYTYYPTTNAHVIMKQDTMDATNTVWTQAQLDPYGRVSRTVLLNGQGSWDQQDTSYNTSGEISFVSYPYQGTGWGTPKVTSGAGDSYTHNFYPNMAIWSDTVTHSDNSSMTTNYVGRASLTTDEGRDATNKIQRISQINGLGVTTAVCEVTIVTMPPGGTAPAQCGLDYTPTTTGYLTSYAYNTLGQLTGVTQGSLSSRSYTYDTLGRALTVTTPESGLTTFTYNADSLIGTRVRPAPNGTSGNVTTTYAYDALHRKTSKSYSDTTPAASFFYDDASCCPYFSPALQNTKGHLVYASAGSNIDYFSYDSMGRVVNDYQAPPNVYGTTSYNLPYTYDYLGDVTAYGNAWSTFTQSFNTAGRLTGITSTYVDATHPATMLSGATYNAFGQPTSYVMGSGPGAAFNNGVQEAFVYNSRGQMTSKTAKNNGGSGSTVFSMTGMTYVPNGALSGVTDTSGATPVVDTVSHAYDDFMRLANLQQSNPSSTLTVAAQYDPYGNRTLQTATVTPGGVTTTTTPSDGTTNHIAAGNGVTYDALGNVRTENGNTYTYDAENRITSVTGASASYFYDAFGRRTRRVVGTNTYDYLYDLAGRAITEINNGSTASRFEVYAGSMHLATYATNTYFSHTNYIGSERVKTDQTGTPVEDCKYLPFGEYKNGACTVAVYSPIHYAGYERDSETGLDHMWFRYYNPRIGRFMSADPLSGGIANPQSLNKFGYVGNNPSNAMDPLGLDSIGPADGLKILEKERQHGRWRDGRKSDVYYFPRGYHYDALSLLYASTHPDYAVFTFIQVGDFKEPVIIPIYPVINSGAFIDSQTTVQEPGEPPQPGSKTDQFEEGMKQIAEVDEALHFAGARVIVPAALINIGAFLSYEGAQLTWDGCETMIGCAVSVPVGGAVAIIGGFLTSEGVYYSINGKPYNPSVIFSGGE